MCSLSNGDTGSDHNQRGEQKDDFNTKWQFWQYVYKFVSNIYFHCPFHLPVFVSLCSLHIIFQLHNIPAIKSKSHKQDSFNEVTRVKLSMIILTNRQWVYLPQYIVLEVDDFLHLWPLQIQWFLENAMF